MLVKTFVVAAIFGMVSSSGTAGPEVASILNPDEEHGVFLTLAENVGGSFDEVVARTRSAFETEGWQVLADFEAGVDDNDCSFRARVIVLNTEAYAAQVMQFGSDAAFALPIRLGVFEDENGIQVTAVNPLSLNRTIISETEFGEQSAAIVSEMRSIVHSAFPENASTAEYGQMRERGLIARTMGLIAGGAFEGKIETIYDENLDGESLSEFGERLYQGLSNVGGMWRWGIRPVYKLDIADAGVIVIGVTADDVESKSFHIVGNGNDDSRSEFACAGINHAAAYPIELIVSSHDGEVRVRAVDGMFRMKMFFEDAGNMKFAANMRMPGRIEDEIRDKVEESLN